MTKPSDRVRKLVEANEPQPTSEQRSRAWRLKIISSSEETIPLSRLCDLLLDELEEILNILSTHDE